MDFGEYTKMSTLGHRKCYNSHSPFKDWRKWGEGRAIVNAMICMFISLGLELEPGVETRDAGTGRGIY